MKLLLVLQLYSTWIRYIVFVEIDKFDENIDSGDVFGSIEAVKTVADLYLPFQVRYLKKTNLEEKPVSNQSPYDDGWIIKVKLMNQLI